MNQQKPFTFDRIVRILLSVGMLAGLIWLAGYLSDVLIPFAVALLLAYLTNPLVSLTQKKISNRAAAVFISLLLIIVLAVLLGWFIIPRIAGEIVQMGRIVTDLVNNSDLAEKASQQLPPDLWQVIKNFFARTEIKEFFKDVILVPRIMGKVTGLNPAMIMLSLSIWGKLLGLLGMIIALPVTYLLLVYYRRLISFVPSTENSSRSQSNP